ncbi:PREDICTED: 39S ribosomal protein L47, mitochondrial [Dufourea novaeangliae]|uniref:Large ribosomal subunit protein uL29m n=1 Tax=Dufourea novaeangliae TaxID=178035 RepID=A0A154PC18_DUFNO|nr:PREDICTED: 39S ribosomal protein L47, mitochondrial [Dufourea novaeangliae]KZC08750.1 39S ribosomal protein L47, mitochondrial [Dufourea novaeangliae]
MAAFTKAIQISKSVNNVTKLLTNLSLTSNIHSIATPIHTQRIPSFQCVLIHTTSKQNDLMEFFDDKKNWGQKEVKVGRSWRTDELRQKSNEDLHKLWFVLLKERNMLLTMEEAYKQKMEYFPNPERIDKVEDSMSNLESVVRERNRAYHLLETGRSGERPAKLTWTILGMRFFYRMRQHVIPKFMNTSWKKTHMFGYNGYAVRKFQRLYKEKLWKAKCYTYNVQNNEVARMMRTFPNLDLEAVKEKYPLADIEKVKSWKRAIGHFTRK